MAASRESAMATVKKTEGTQEQTVAPSIKSLQELIFSSLGTSGAPPLAYAPPDSLTNKVGYRLFELLGQGRYVEMRKILDIYPSWVKFIAFEYTNIEGNDTELRETKAELQEAMHQKLLHHVVFGEQDKAEGLLKICPELLRLSGTAKGPSAGPARTGTALSNRVQRRRY